jgi:hypothetical protein
MTNGISTVRRRSFFIMLEVWEFRRSPFSNFIPCFQLFARLKGKKSKSVN